MGLSDVDLKGIEFIYTYIQTPFLDNIMLVISKLGSGGAIWFLIAIALVLSKQYRNTGWLVLCSLVVALMLSEGLLKNLVQRPRPFMEVSQLKLILEPPTSYSFPSAHASMAFAVLTSLVGSLRNPWIIAGLIIFGLSMAFSRLYLLLHYPSDIIGGIIIGIFSALVAKRLLALKNRGDQN